MAEERRLRRLVVMPEFFLCLLEPGEHRYEIEGGLPADYRFRGVAHDLREDVLMFYIEHPSFDPVELGAEIPELNRPIMTAESK